MASKRFWQWLKWTFSFYDTQYWNAAILEWHDLHMICMSHLHMFMWLQRWLTLIIWPVFSIGCTTYCTHISLSQSWLLSRLLCICRLTNQNCHRITGRRFLWSYDDTIQQMKRNCWKVVEFFLGDKRKKGAIFQNKWFHQL